MGYKWKPNAAQKRAYIDSLEAKKQVETHTTPHAIRNGCYLEYFNVSKGVIIKGIVTNNSYGAKTKQHTFTIDGVKVKGRNLYPNTINHIQGEESKLVSNRSLEQIYVREDAEDKHWKDTATYNERNSY